MKRSVALVVAIALVTAGYLFWRDTTTSSTAGTTADGISASGPTGERRASVVGTPATSPRLSSTAAAAPIAASRHKTPYEPLPPGPVREYLPGLLVAANAKSATAEENWRAFTALNACRAQDKLAELRAAQQNPAAAGKADKPVQASGDSGVPDCRGVSKEDVADSMRYLKRAAEGGDDRAVYQYASGLPLMYMDQADLIKHPEAVLEWRADSIRYLNNAIGSGSTEALIALSRAYQQGTLGEQNPVLAYQYMLAWRQVALSADNPDADAFPNRLAANLTPEEVARAQLGAQALVARMGTQK
jgi:hypothetical protein